MSQNTREVLPQYFTDELTRNFRLITLKKGEYLFHVGDRVEGIYYILSGEIKAIRNMMEGNECIMMRSHAGDYFAESALATDKYVCDGQCSKTAQFVFMPRNEISRALENSVFSMNFSLALAKNSRRQCSRYERLRLNKASDRLLHLLNCESDPNGLLSWKSSLTELAYELAIEPETLYRVLSELEKEGVIRRQKRNIQLL